MTSPWQRSATLTRDDAEVDEHAREQLVLAFQMLARLRGASQILDPRAVIEILLPAFGLRDFHERLLPERDLRGRDAARKEKAAPGIVGGIDALLAKSRNRGELALLARGRADRHDTRLAGLGLRQRSPGRADEHVDVAAKRRRQARAARRED